jgi:hypothetical protein
METIGTPRQMHHEGRALVSQLSSPLFRLPAELRVTIYECLEYPPINNEQCAGLVLSCRQAKLESEGVAMRSFKTWIAAFRRSVITKCEFDVRIYLASAPTVGLGFGFRNIRELVLVLPSTCCELAMSLTSFYVNLRQLNSIFSLWLDKLTIHFQGFLGDNYSKGRLAKVYSRLLFILEGGLTYGHDPVGQAREKVIRKYSNMWNHWMPEPSFVKQLVISWDMTQGGLPSDGLMQLKGVEHHVHSSQCIGRSMYRVTDDTGMLGEYSLASYVRFKPSARERPTMRSSHGHCSECTHNRDHQRDFRGLPDEASESWVR